MLEDPVIPKEDKLPKILESVLEILIDTNDYVFTTKSEKKEMGSQTDRPHLLATSTIYRIR
jgi:hypothetical protein